MKNSTVKTAVGSRFGKWTVVSRTRDSHVMCKCDCGTDREIHVSNLTSGRTESCGCNRKISVALASTRHGMYGTPTYSTWSSMMTRCTNQNCKSFPGYGGRGISVCESWKSFDNFFADMGEKPRKGMSIERINNNGNYEPGNCRWATGSEQARNTRRTKITPLDVSQLRDGSMSINEVVTLRNCAKSTASMAKRGANWKEI